MATFQVLNCHLWLVPSRLCSSSVYVFLMGLWATFYFFFSLPIHIFWVLFTERVGFITYELSWIIFLKLRPGWTRLSTSKYFFIILPFRRSVWPSSCTPASTQVADPRVFRLSSCSQTRAGLPYRIKQLPCSQRLLSRCHLSSFACNTAYPITVTSP